MPTNPVFEMDNRSKRGMAVDLSRPEGVEILFNLLEDADVFITNLRPGGLKRLGIDFESIKDTANVFEKEIKDLSSNDQEKK